MVGTSVPVANAGENKDSTVPGEEKIFDMCQKCGWVQIYEKENKVLGMNLPHKHCTKCHGRIFNCGDADRSL